VGGGGGELLVLPLLGCSLVCEWIKNIDKNEKWIGNYALSILSGIVDCSDRRSSILSSKICRQKDFGWIKTQQYMGF